MSLEAEYYGDKKHYQDPYCYPGTDVLINDKGIKDKAHLESLERGIIARRLLRLHIEKEYGDFSYDHYLSLHHYLFRGIYPFAGKIRYTDIIKESTYFARHEFIEANLTGILDKMNKQVSLCTTKEEFAYFLSSFYLDLNMLHPFREGNGRAQREFIREFVEVKSQSLPFGPLILDYSKLDKMTVLNGTLGSSDEIVANQILLGLVSPSKIR